MDAAKSTEKVRATAAQITSARVFLKLKQVELGKAAGVDPATISTFETGNRPAYESTREKLQTALEARGIVFTNGDKPGFYFDKDKVIIPS
jgi:transcriptional regulator with XRE-family HTH domain